MDKEFEMLLEQIEIDAHEDEAIMNYVKLIHLSAQYHLGDFEPSYDPTVLLKRLVAHVENRYDYSTDLGEYPFAGAGSWIHEAKNYLAARTVPS